MFNVDKTQCTQQEYMRHLVDYLNARTAEYDRNTPTITDQYWDELYFELKKLEETTGIYYPDSPTQAITYNVVEKLERVTHDHLMLSLDKTKELQDVETFLGQQDFVGMCKMDGLTCSLKYVKGVLVNAETRGNGTLGFNVLHNAQVISNIPKKINYQEELIIDGEVICKLNDFQQFAEEFKHPRNFAAGSLKLLDSKECAKRHLSFIAWDVIKGLEQYPDFFRRLKSLDSLGFETVPTKQGTVKECVDSLKQIAEIKGYPIDGVVFKFNNIAYGESLGRTTHHFKNAIAYKFYDETYTTVLRNIEWTMGRTGVLTPIAIFDPVNDDGAILERASLHNLAVLTEILGKPYKGQQIEIMRSNMIIPMVVKGDKNIPPNAEMLAPPAACPICGGVTRLNAANQVVCTNEDCDGKFINKLEHFRGPRGLNIRGFSKLTMEKFIENGWLKSFADLINFEAYSNACRELKYFGIKFTQNIAAAIEEGRHTTLTRFLSAIGIPGVGPSVAKILANNVTDYMDFRAKVGSKYDFTAIGSIGSVLCDNILTYDYSMADEVYPLLDITNIHDSEQEVTTKCQGENIVITNGLVFFKNRAELENVIKINGGKTSSAVSNKTTILINNYPEKKNAKQQKATELNINVMSEEEFLKKFDLPYGATT